MGLLTLCMTFLTLLVWRHLVYSTVSCPSGDTQGIIKNGSTCSQLISSTNYECYNVTIETSCCASCNAIATGISGCQYGNRVDQCALALCPEYTDLNECCFTCRVTTTIETMTTTMTPSPAGNNSTSSFIQSVSTATTTITSSTAENNITRSASQSSSSQSTSTGVIAGSVVGSLAGTGLIAGVTYAGVQFFKSTKLRRVDIA